MRTLLACVFCLAACGGKSNGGADAPGGDDDDAPPGGGNTVSLTLAHLPANATMFEFAVAYQDGTGAWTAAPAPAGDTFTLPIASATYGYAWTCRTVGNPNGNDVKVTRLGFAAVAEKPSITDTVPAGCTEPPATVALTGTVSNRGAQGGRFVATWGTTSATVEAATGTFTMQVEPGTHDLVVTRAQAIGGAGGGGDVVVDRATVVRGVAVTAATTQNVDFATALDVTTAAVTIAAGAQQRATATTTLFTANGTEVTMVRDATAPLEANGLATALAAAGDVYDQSMTVGGGGGGQATTSSAAAAVAAATFTAPPPLGGATATTAATTPYPQILSTWQAYPNAVGYRWTANQQAAGGGTVTWVADVSATYAGASPKFQMPDLSAIPGWIATHQLVTGTPVQGNAEAFTSSAGAGDFPFGTPAAGTQRTTVRSGWNTTP